MKKTIYLFILFIQFSALRSEPLEAIWRRESAPDVQASVFHPKLDFLAFKYKQNIKVWNYKTGEIMFEYFDTNIKNIKDLKFSADGRSLYALYEHDLNNTKYMEWDWQTGVISDSFVFQERFNWLEISPNEKYICGIADSQLTVYNRVTKAVVHNFDTASEKWATQACYFNNGNNMALLQTKKVKLLNIESGKIADSIRVNTEYNMSMFVSPNGKYLVLSFPYVYDVFDLNKLEYIKSFDRNIDFFRCFINDSVMICNAKNKNYQVHYLNLLTGELKFASDFNMYFYDYKLEDGSLLLSCQNDNYTNVYQCSDSTDLETYGQNPSSVMFTDDSKYIVFPNPEKNYNNRGFCFDAKTGYCENTFNPRYNGYYGYFGGHSYIKYNEIFDLITGKKLDSIIKRYNCTYQYSADGKYTINHYNTLNEGTDIFNNKTKKLLTNLKIVGDMIKCSNEIALFRTYNKNPNFSDLLFYDLINLDTLSLIVANEKNVNKNNIVFISPDRQTFYEIRSDSLVCRSIFTGEDLRVFKGYSYEQINSFDFCTNGEYLISSLEKGFINFYDTKSGEQKYSLSINDTNVFSFAVSPDMSKLATVLEDGTLTCYDISGVITSTPEVMQPATNNNLHIYPNPASDKLYIQTGGMAYESAEVKIVNELGIVMKSGIYAGGAAIELDVSDLAQGIYHCLLKTNDNFLVDKFIIVR